MAPMAVAAKLAAPRVQKQEDFMRYAMWAGVVALAFCGGSGIAVAQSTSSIPGQGSPQEKFHLNATQEKNIMRGLNNEQAQTPPSGFQGQLGSKAPDSMNPHQLPNDVADQAPQIKGYYFVKLPDRVLLLDPDTKIVVEIVADDGQTTGAGTGSGPSSNPSSGTSPGGSPSTGPGTNR
jgi:hypothetical protein